MSGIGADASPTSGRDASPRSSETQRPCAWCREPIPPTHRRDARCCSKRCRQAIHRFTRAIGHCKVSDRPLRLAYADPPYPTLARTYYRDHPDYAGEVDHGGLLEHLSTFDGWVLHTSARALPGVLQCAVSREPRPFRVAAWLRGSRGRSTPSMHPLAAWEPVLYVGARPPSPNVDDALHFVSRPRLTDPARVVGSKPATVIRWAFDLMGARSGDTLIDLFPGSGGVSRAWNLYTNEEATQCPASILSPT